MTSEPKNRKVTLQFPLTPTAQVPFRSPFKPIVTRNDSGINVHSAAADSPGKAERERVKQASKSLLASLLDLLRPMQDWTEKAATQAQVRVFILDNLYQNLPRPLFTDAETEEIVAGCTMCGSEVRADRTWRQHDREG